MASSTHNNRIVVLIDMDCFYVQVEQRREPSTRGKPCAVVQYNKWKGGGIIAVGYEARAKGVTRQMRGDDAKQKCPEIILFQVPTAHGKADLTRYRDAGAEVINVLLQFSGVVERASIDEAYIDLTDVINRKLLNDNCTLTDKSELPNTHVVGFPKNPETEEHAEKRLEGLMQFLSTSKDDQQVKRLALAARIVEEMREAIYQQTSFRCSAGISHNKMLSKLACGINKPNKQTILPLNQVRQLFNGVKIKKIRNLGGKLGNTLSLKFEIEYIGQVVDIPVNELVEHFGQKTGLWLSEVCHGVDHEAVKERHVAQSVGCSKNFTGSDALNTKSKVEHWTTCLVKELVERLAKDKLKNNRAANGLTLHVGYQHRNSLSRSTNIDQYEVDHVTSRCLATLSMLNEARDPHKDIWEPAITMLGMSSKGFKNLSGPENGGGQNVKRLLEKQKSKNSPKKSTSESKDDNNNKQGAENTKKEKTKEASKKSTFIDKFLSVSNTLPPPAEAETNHESAKSSSDNQSLKAHQAKTIARVDADHSTDNLQDQFKVERVLFGNSERKPANRSTATAVPKQQTKPETAQTLGNEQTNQIFPYANTEIDQDVFNSLPLFLQQEIRAAMGDSPAARKRSSPCSPGKRNGPMSKYLRPLQQSPASNSPAKSLLTTRTDGKKSKKLNGKSTKGSTKKSLARVDNSRPVPLGFFRARSQASAAIRDAIRNQSSDVVAPKFGKHNSVTKKNQTDEKAPFKAKSLWSSVLDPSAPTYKCPECDAMVPIGDVSSHSDFHERQSSVQSSTAE